ncbi:MAG: NUDIX domain-containing protein [Candidatus Shapirobacteria bacterium]|jgi:8-oxo-dGTP pyrophosphatase MutT (NUDIX family)
MKNIEPKVTEFFVFDGRKIQLSWFLGLPDPSLKVSQVSAYCIYIKKLILVKNKRGWGIPGGHPEDHETCEQALKRELYEEVGIEKNFQSKLIGWMKVEDPGNPGLEGKVSIQLRYVIILDELPAFTPNPEIFERRLVDINDFDKYVSWASSPTGRAQISALILNLI